MKHLAWATLLLTGCAAGERAATPPAYPRATLSNGAVRSTVYLPDATAGFYRGARFDWAGMIARVEWNGHTVFGPWRDKPHDPTSTDDVVGPATEFGMSAPPGYATAAAGETFVKIGVGRLRKPVEEKYWFANRYEIVDHGRWTTRRGRDWIEFTHELADPRGSAYRYTKRVTLTAAPPGFVMDHTLSNVGTSALFTDVYCHNFVVFDDQPVGPAHRIELAGAVTRAQLVGEVVEIGGREIRFRDATRPDRGYWAELTGVTTNDFMFAHDESGVALRVTGDGPPAKMVFYAIGKAVCVEPFLDLAVPPGGERTWQTRYQLTRGTGRR
jgi:hypothetical protein